MMLARPVGMLMFVLVSMVMLMTFCGRVFMAVVRCALGFLAGQSASAIFTHYSISIEASSISRPARNSPLGAWH
jgi:hypothetical protein